jgi:hypothetical protein
MDVKSKVRNITFSTSEHFTHARVELFNGLIYEVESPYVSHISNSFGEKYAAERAYELLKKFDEYAKLENSHEKVS